MGKIVAVRHKSKWRHKGAKKGIAHKRKSRWLTKDKGKKGKYKGKKWYKPEKTLHGWSKDLPEAERRRKASIGRDDLSSGRALMALSLVSTDPETKRKARNDAKYFFALHKKK